MLWQSTIPDNSLPSCVQFMKSCEHGAQTPWNSHALYTEPSSVLPSVFNPFLFAFYKQNITEFIQIILVLNLWSQFSVKGFGFCLFALLLVYFKDFYRGETEIEAGLPFTGSLPKAAMARTGQS